MAQDAECHWWLLLFATVFSNHCHDSRRKTDGNSSHASINLWHWGSGCVGCARQQGQEPNERGHRNHFFHCYVLIQIEL
jgi:hypothetical protein